MTVLTHTAAEPTATELDGLAKAALTRITADSDERQTDTRRNLAEFTAANNVSMMGGWT